MLLPVLQFPDPRLKIQASPVAEIDTSIKELAHNMFETMYEERGIGLAATQVNVHQRVIVIDLQEPDSTFCLINPEIIDSKGQTISDEGCLSFPGVYGKVKRFEDIRVRYQNLEGETQELEASGLLSICIQHELDHLNGITFYDHLSALKKARIRKKFEDLRRRVL